MSIILVTRKDAGLVPPRYTNPFKAHKGVGWHWGGANGLQDIPHSQCLDLWRAWQKMHMAPGGLGTANGAADIAYNEGFCNHGGVFQGRGFENANGANGNAKDNAEWLAVCWINGGPGTHLSLAAKEAMAYIRGQASSREFANVNEPHYFFHETQCCGSELSDAIKNFPSGGTPQMTDKVDAAVIPGWKASNGEPGRWVLQSDGGIFTYPEEANAAGLFHGSMGGHPLNAPMSGIIAHGAGGYWTVAQDGGIFAFGDAPAVEPYSEFFNEYRVGAHSLIDGDFDGQILTVVASDGAYYTYKVV